jgi:hypothetical protein
MILKPTQIDPNYSQKNVLRRPTTAETAAKTVGRTWICIAYRRDDIGGFRFEHAAEPEVGLSSISRAKGSCFVSLGLGSPSE